MTHPAETTPVSPQPLEATNAEFAMIAAWAAMELDQIILGRKSELTHVSRIAELLSASTSSNEAIQYPGLNAAFFAVVGEAFNITNSVPLQSSDKIIAAASEVAGKLMPDSSHPPKANLESMRAFCVALSQAALNAGFGNDAGFGEHPLRE